MGLAESPRSMQKEKSEDRGRDDHMYLQCNGSRSNLDVKIWSYILGLEAIEMIKF